jgi:hypothetical protein
MDMQAVSLFTASRVDVQFVSLFTASSIDGQAVSLSTASMDVQGYPFPLPVVWTMDIQVVKMYLFFLFL